MLMTKQNLLALNLIFSQFMRDIGLKIMNIIINVSWDMILKKYLLWRQMKLVRLESIFNFNNNRFIDVALANGMNKIESVTFDIEPEDKK